MTKNTQSPYFFWKKYPISRKIQLKWIFRVILVGLLAQMMLSGQLWWKSEGVLPYLPLFFTEGAWLEKSSIVLFPAFLLLVLINFCLPQKKIFLKFLLLSGVLLILGNIHRFQVWFYFYGLILFLYLWKQYTSAEVLIATLRGVVAGVYSWSGLHKFNNYFVEDIFPWLIEPLEFLFHSLPSECAYGAGGVELLIGIGLLLSPTRNISVVCSIIFHIIILGLLGPFGHNWNPVVWPWNLVMPLLVFLLFFEKEKLTLNNRVFTLRSFPAGLLVLGIVWILPAFNYLGFTPEQLSFKMYAGSQPEIVLYYGEKDRGLMKEHPTIHGALPSETSPRYRVVLDDIAFVEWGTPLFTTPTTARKIAQQFCQKMQRPEEGGLLYLVADEFVQIPCQAE